MALPNAFDPASTHPAVAVRALVATLLAQHKIAVRFHHGNPTLRFGERPIANEWLRLATRIARRRYEIEKGAQLFCVGLPTCTTLREIDAPSVRV
jgi:hypothetical protein